MQVATIENDIYQSLRVEGVELAIFAITAQGLEWKDRVSGYDEASFYVAPDTDGNAYQLFGADPYDVFLLDKEGRLVTNWVGYHDDSLTDAIKLKIRQLRDE